jgi:hypothetical protein
MSYESLTRDRGREFADHRRAPAQRGSRETLQFETPAERFGAFHRPVEPLVFSLQQRVQASINLRHLSKASHTPVQRECFVSLRAPPRSLNDTTNLEMFLNTRPRSTTEFSITMDLRICSFRGSARSTYFRYCRSSSERCRSHAAGRGLSRSSS